MKMENLKVELTDETTMVITVDLSKDIGPSSSGKSTVIASTKGNRDVPGAPGVKIGLNVFRPVGEDA